MQTAIKEKYLRNKLENDELFRMAAQEKKSSEKLAEEGEEHTV